MSSLTHAQNPEMICSFLDLDHFLSDQFVSAQVSGTSITFFPTWSERLAHLFLTRCTQAGIWDRVESSSGDTSGAIRWNDRNHAPAKKMPSVSRRWFPFTFASHYSILLSKRCSKTNDHDANHRARPCAICCDCEDAFVCLCECAKEVWLSPVLVS